MSEFRTAKGMVDVNMSEYSNIHSIYEGQDIARAKPIEHPMPIEANGGGELNFSAQTIGAFMEASA